MSQAEKQELVKECRSSGMTAKAWCATKEISYRQYVAWATRYNRAAKAIETAPRWAALEIVKGNAEEEVETEIRLECGKWRICVGNGFSPSLLADMLRAVNAVC